MKRFLFILVFLLAQPGLASFIDKSESAFFPSEISKPLEIYGVFPAFWWGFFVLEYDDEANGLAKAGEACALLSGTKDISRAECGEDLRRYEELVRSWASDIVLREPAPPPAALAQKMDEALARASLPLPKPVFQMLRLDPLGSHRELLALMSSKLKLKLTRESGFFFDKGARRVVIPIQLSFPPSDGDRSRLVRDLLPRWDFVGPHASALENRERVHHDLEVISLVGTLIWLAFVGYLIHLKYGSLLLIFPPVIVGNALAALTVIAIFGKIHGLALSFGAGIIGLTVDYGLHLAFSTRPGNVWRSNAAGFLTTMICLIVLMFSRVPLLQQIMLFAALGFAYSYLLLFATHRLFPEKFRAEPMRFVFRSSPARLLAVGLLLVGVVLGAIFVRPQLDLRSFNYQSDRTKVLTEWLFKPISEVPTLFEIHRTTSPLEAAHDELSWSKQNDVAVENVANYLPAPARQSENLATWKERQCGPRPFASTLSAETKALFAPFWDTLACEKLRPNLLHDTAPAYLRHLTTGEHWLTMWLPATNDERLRVSAAYPGARSLFEMVSEFPKTLQAELLWMGPLSVLLVGLILMVYFRSARCALLALLPFFTGVGLMAWFSVLFGMPISFISLVGAVMILGLSVDYAIFTIDHFRFREADSVNEREEAGAATALMLAAGTTLAGFLPMVFCRHQVLAHLGYSLTLGTLGTIVGALWAVPALKKWIPKA